MTIAKFLILQCSRRWGRRLIGPVTTAARSADFARLDGLHTPSVLGGDGLLAKISDRIRNPRAVGILRLLRDSVAFRVVFGAGATSAYDASRVLVDGDGRSGSKGRFLLPIDVCVEVFPRWTSSVPVLLVSVGAGSVQGAVQFRGSVLKVFKEDVLLVGGVFVVVVLGTRLDTFVFVQRALGEIPGASAD